MGNFSDQTWGESRLADNMVFLPHWGATRDQEIFDQAHVFEMDRDINNHVALELDAAGR